MNLNERAALVIRSLMREARVSDHLVFPKGGGAVSAEKLLEELEAPKVGDGTPDAALAIGEHAFRAGWDARKNMSFYMEDGQKRIRPNRPQTVDEAWDAYDPPEHIRELS